MQSFEARAMTRNKLTKSPGIEAYIYIYTQMCTYEVKSFGSTDVWAPSLVGLEKEKRIFKGADPTRRASFHQGLAIQISFPN